jgi:hypothetical protein
MGRTTPQTPHSTDDSSSLFVISYNVDVLYLYDRVFQSFVLYNLCENGFDKSESNDLF